ncbi:hypothetical protein ABH931_005486 [Streptacidiphilus sp. MAP12-33]|uniref:hypothetical protein n=1 Tax=Streptacidiphilus sp. MAP12-33 TaxID=3156266 RepID=UPI003515B738
MPTRPRPSASRAHPPSAFVWLVPIGMLAGAVAVFLGVGPNLAGSLRLTGAPGTLAVHSCSTVGSGKQAHTRCTGTFTSDDGTVQDPSATIDVPLATGGTVPVQRAADGSLVQVGVVPAAGWIAVLFLGLATAALGCLCAVLLIRRPASLDHLGVLRPDAPERRLAKYAGLLCCASVAAALLSGLISVAGRLVQ